MALPRPCLDCGVVTTNGSRCPIHQRQQDTKRGSTTQRMGSGWQTLSQHILKRDHYHCQLGLPGCTEQATTVDHITPRHQGGTNHPSNLQAACRSCNSRKGHRTR